MAIFVSSPHLANTDNPPSSPSDLHWRDNSKATFFVIPAVVVSVGIIVVVGLNIYLRRRALRQRSPPPDPLHNNPPSRVTEIAKSLLDALPIVKFGNVPDRGRGDGLSEEDAELGTVTPSDRGDSNTSPTPDQEPLQSREGESHAGLAATRVPNTACPICTESFTFGQGLRVLPCRHQFHPTCVDPWLLQRSSTCPMCRSDLRRTI